MKTLSIMLLVSCLAFSASATVWIQQSVYHMDSSTGVLTDSGPASNTLGAINSPAPITGYLNQGVNLAGTATQSHGFKITPDSYGNINTNGLNIGCYAKPATTQATRDWAQLGSMGGYWNLGFVVDSSMTITAIEFRVRHSSADGGDEKVSIAFTPDGQWHYFGGSYDPITHQISVTLDSTTVSLTANGNPISKWGLDPGWILVGGGTSGGTGAGLISDIDEYTISTIPEPATMTLFAFGALTLLNRRKQH